MPLSILRLLLSGLLMLLAGPAVAAEVRADARTLVLHEAQTDVEAWPAVRLLADPGGTLDWQAALQRTAEFKPPEGPAGNLGIRRETMWLALALRAADGNGEWVFDIDYPAFNEAQLTLVADDGRPVQQATLGSRQPFDARPMHTRSHAVTLHLQPGRSHQLLLRLRTDSSMVLPLSLSKPDAYHAREARRLVAQGLMLGLAAALLLYSLVHAIGLRQGLFALYAAMVLGSTAFFLDFSGLGQQLLWSERQGITAMISPLSVLLAMAAGGCFAMQGLQTAAHAPRLHRGMQAIAGLAATLLVLGLLGLLSYRQAQLLATAIGPVVPVLATVGAWRRLRQGDRVARYMLLGWACYVAGAICAAGLLRGWLPATYVTMNVFQWSTLLEMLAWWRMLGLHIEAQRREAERNAAAVLSLSAMAQTDALTGLPNRRGLDTALRAALPRADARRLLAVFMIDLDGFKAVNDRLGHAAGDQLLVTVSQRLTSAVRRNDLVARLGGDEFVVLAEGLPSESDAQLIGAKLLAAFAEPVNVAGQPCRIGLTIGFALAPLDSSDVADLLHLADAAMYAGKRGGRHQYRRASPRAAVPA